MKKNNYDVFISFKNTEEDKDRKIANKIYEYLTKNALKVFFSDTTLAKYGIDNWNNEIYNAIEVSKVFISVGTKRAYMEMKHLQSERTAFLTHKRSDNQKAIYSYIGGDMTLDELPNELRDFECFQDNVENELDRLLKKIQSHLAKYTYNLNYTSIKYRKKEIEDYILKYNNFDNATKRLIDFVGAYSEVKRRKDKADKIRRKYLMRQEEKKRVGLTRDLEERFLELQEEILDLLLDTEEEYNSNKPRQEEVQKVYKNKDNIVFIGKNITKEYKKKSANFKLEAIDLELKYGEITAVMGENGNGKTTLLNIIAGELLQSSGETKYPELIKIKSDWYTIKTQIGYIKQELEPWYGLVKDNLHFTAGVNGIRGEDNIREVNRIILRLGLQDYEDAKWNELSGGFKMRFSLARVMLRRPKLLILDEPLANLDPNTQNIFLEDLKSFVSNPINKMSIIITSQHIPQIESVADNIIYIKNGKTKFNDKMKKFEQDRSENIYELDVDIEEDELREVLSRLKKIEIKKSGYLYILYTERDVKSKMLLQLFAQHDVNVKYFRDISQSTKKFFGEKNE